MDIINIKIDGTEFLVYTKTIKKYGDGFIARANKAYCSCWCVVFYDADGNIYDFDYDEGDYYD